MGVSTSNRVIVGKDGWLFQNGRDHANDIRNIWPFSLGELKHWARILSIKHNWLKSQGIEYVFIIPPSKHLIYPEKLPAAFKPVHKTSRMDQLVHYLGENTDITIVYMRERLIDAKERLRPYHKTDTHWNSYGAYLGYLELMSNIHRKLPDLKLVKIKRKAFAMRTEKGKDLAQSLNLQNKIKEEAPFPEKWNGECLYNSTIKGEQNIVNRNRQWFPTSCDHGNYKAVMFRDSYSLAMMPYLSETFSSIYYVPHSPANIKTLKEIILEQKPDTVFELRTSRWLRTPEG